MSRFIRGLKLAFFLLGFLFLFNHEAAGQDLPTGLPRGRPAPSPTKPLPGELPGAQAAPSPLVTTLQGVINDKSGAVMNEVIITVKNRSTGQTFETSTDSEGRFKIPNLRPGRYDVKVSRTGFKSFSLPDVAVGNDQTSSLNITLGDDTQPGVVRPAVTGTLRGVVRHWNHSGRRRALADAEVIITQQAGSETWIVRTDANGKYEKNLPPGRYKVIAKKDGFRSSNEVPSEIRANRRTNLIFSLLPN
jgi:uncharacterized surface anchored protein